MRAAWPARRRRGMRSAAAHTGRRCRSPAGQRRCTRSCRAGPAGLCAGTMSRCGPRQSVAASASQGDAGRTDLCVIPPRSRNSGQLRSGLSRRGCEAGVALCIPARARPAPAQFPGSAGLLAGSRGRSRTCRVTAIGTDRRRVRSSRPRRPPPELHRPRCRRRSTRRGCSAEVWCPERRRSVDQPEVADVQPTNSSTQNSPPSRPPPGESLSTLRNAPTVLRTQCQRHIPLVLDVTPRRVGRTARRVP